MVITQAKGHIRPDSVKISLTRRAAFAGVALLAAPSTALAVCVAPDGTHPIDELWTKRRELVRRSATVSASYRTASKALPAWADSGHEYVRKSDGQVYGCRVFWSELESPLDAGDHFIVRPHPRQIKHWASNRPRAEYRAAMRDFVKRRRETIRIWDEAGLTALGEESQWLVNETSAVEHELVRQADSSPDIRAAAAHCIISLTYSFTGGDGFAVFDEGAAASR